MVHLNRNLIVALKPKADFNFIFLVLASLQAKVNFGLCDVLG
jgi:hypothetical protein